MRWINSGMTIIPAVNMVLNLGFGDDATHTKSVPDANKVRQFQELQFPIRHPKVMIRNAGLEGELVVSSQFCVKAAGKIQRKLSLWAKKLKTLVD